MDDLISRVAAIAKVEKARKAARTLTGMDFVLMLKGQPAVDAVPVVRCRDCKHRPIDNRDEDDRTGFAIEFPDSRCPCQCEDGWYSWYPSDDWFCAGGERRDDDGSTD